MRNHVTILGWLQILLGLLDLLMALVLFGVVAGLGLLGGFGGDPSGMVVGGLVGTFLAGLVGLTAVPNLLAGWGLLTHRNWGRILALVLAVLNGLKVPWGTAFAIYSLWVLTHDRTRILFDA
ncbi:MAG: hypothetical protein PVI57_01385 [Gemmatimonadota bacterium]|jgi:hypothetical protein